MFNPEELYRKEKRNNCHVSASLNFIKMTVDFFYSNGVANILTRITQLSLLSWTVVQIIYFMKFPSAQFIWDFGYSFFALSYVFTMISIKYNQKSDMDAMDACIEKFFWNIKCCGPEMLVTFSDRVRIGKNLAWMQFLIGATNGFLFLPFESERLDLFFILTFLTKYYPEFYRYYKYIFFCLTSWGTTLVITQANIYLYHIVQLDFQYKLLTKHIEDIERGIKEDYLSEKYNLEIRRRMKICVAHFQKLTEFRQQFLDLIYYAFLFVLWIGLGVSMFIAYHLLVMKNSENFIALSFLWITVAECTCQLSLLGQHYIDMAEDFLFTLTRCKWYKWSNYNKKSYLLFLIYAQNYKIVCVGGFIPYNLSLAIWMSRKTLSALTFFRAVRRIDNVA